jgi:YfiH family protein
MGPAEQLTGGRDWLVPDWPAPACVQALCTTRRGWPVSGRSLAPWNDFNLGDHVGDARAAVDDNRLALARQMSARPVFLQQVHGTDVLTMTRSTSDGAAADACTTMEAGLACTIMVADCLPVLMCTADGAAVAAAHAGWRGLAGGVLENTARALRQAQVALKPEDAQRGAVMAWLGPCIGPQAFEVGAEVRAAFLASDEACAGCFVAHAPGKYLADLAGLARRRLAASGVTQISGNDGSPPWCTVGNPSLFFSHRRDRVSGRFAAAIWIR